MARTETVEVPSPRSSTARFFMAIRYNCRYTREQVGLDGCSNTHRALASTPAINRCQGYVERTQARRVGPIFFNIIVPSPSLPAESAS